MKYLLLWFEAPLQAWGHDSKFDLRQTFSFPTKSGVFGLLLAASGDAGAQCELLERMRNSEFTAVSLEKQAVVNSPSLMDYQTVGNGYDKSKLWDTYQLPRKHKHSDPKEKGGIASTCSRQTYRYYLQDKKFAVILGFEDDLAEKFAASLKAPVFDLYLGRKCCVPTDLIFRGIFDLEEDAIKKMLEVAEDKELKPSKKLIQVEATQEALLDDAFFLTDVPLEFGPTKRYADRCVRIVPYE